MIKVELEQNLEKVCFNFEDYEKAVEFVKVALENSNNTKVNIKEDRSEVKVEQDHYVVTIKKGYTEVDFGFEIDEQQWAVSFLTEATSTLLDDNAEILMKCNKKNIQTKGEE